MDIQVGDRITFKCKNRNKTRISLILNEVYIEEFMANLRNKEIEILKIERPNYRLIFGQKEEKEILDDKEKEYLKRIIRPFKDKVTQITKHQGFGIEFISIKVVDNADIDLPKFKKGTIYKGMEANSPYILKELKLED